jgi:hypothetical protein
VALAARHVLQDLSICVKLVLVSPGVMNDNDNYYRGVCVWGCMTIIMMLECGFAAEPQRPSCEGSQVNGADQAAAAGAAAAATELGQWRLLLLRFCCVQVPELLVWIERLREWLAGQLLAPLVQLMESAHDEPNALMVLLANGQQAPQLPPITTLLEVDIDADSTQMQPAAAGGSSGGGLAGFLGLSGSSGAAGGGFMGGGALVGFGGLGQLGGRVQGSAAGGDGGSNGASAAEDARNAAQRLIQMLRTSQLPYGYDPEPLVLVSHAPCL